ncbi:MAG: multiheme c-type cytochrome [Saprospiraceae bacterium]
MKKKKYFIIASLFLAAFVYYCISTAKGLDYYQPEPLATHFNGEAFVGSRTCMECHADISTTHLQTAHFNTSASANAKNIKGSFKKGANTVKLEEVEFEMVKKGKSFYQLTTLNSPGQQIPPEKIDIVVGSGVKGQSYLTWEDDYLFQLQVSYYPPLDTWINSPGYPDRLLKRPIRDGCLKCHVTFATNRDFSGQGNQYDQAKMVYGVDCERCHRPAAKHVIFHRNNPDVKAAKFMLKLDTLSRQQRLDACAQCHSGPRDNIIQGNSFTYLTGETLKDYSRNFYTGQPDSALDVHGNQYGLLTTSKCFIQSANMDCSTCHDPHKKQRGNRTHFNEKCIGCHSPGSSVTCTAEMAVRETKANNCITCHMPNSPSKGMSVELNSLKTSVYVRTHLIGVYPKESWLD